MLAKHPVIRSGQRVGTVFDFRNGEHTVNRLGASDALSQRCEEHQKSYNSGDHEPASVR